MPFTEDFRLIPYLRTCVDMCFALVFLGLMCVPSILGWPVYLFAFWSVYASSFLYCFRQVIVHNERANATNDLTIQSTEFTFVEMYSNHFKSMWIYELCCFATGSLTDDVFIQMYTAAYTKNFVASFGPQFHLAWFFIRVYFFHPKPSSRLERYFPLACIILVYLALSLAAYLSLMLYTWTITMELIYFPLYSMKHLLWMGPVIVVFVFLGYTYSSRGANGWNLVVVFVLFVAPYMHLCKTTVIWDLLADYSQHTVITSKQCGVTHIYFKGNTQNSFPCHDLEYHAYVMNSLVAFSGAVCNGKRELLQFDTKDYGTFYFPDTVICNLNTAKKQCPIYREPSLCATRNFLVATGEKGHLKDIVDEVLDDQSQSLRARTPTIPLDNEVESEARVFLFNFLVRQWRASPAGLWDFLIGHKVRAWLL